MKDELGSTDLLGKLIRHIAQMAPHQKERDGGRLLIDATAEIVQLRTWIHTGRTPPTPTRPPNNHDASPVLAPVSSYAAGARVQITDHSEAHGDIGTVLWVQNNGLIIVELDGEKCCWPVTADELKPHNVTQKSMQ